MVVKAWVYALLLAPSLAGAATDGEMRRGREIYQERCVLCHGSQGRGWDWDAKAARPPVPVPDLVKIVPRRSDAYLVTVIRDGGEAVGKTRFMPAFGFDMSERDLKDVVAYVRSLSASGK